MSRNIVICEYISTGFNYIDDALARGYEPVLLESQIAGTEEDQALFRALREPLKAKLKGRFRVIPENPDYDEVLRQVKELDPVLVIAGSEFGVSLATRLAEDLGLPGNPASRLRAMTEKDSMHQALKDHGLRSIRGKVVTSEDEAVEYYKELGKEDVVVKRVRGAGTQGVYICHGYDEMLRAVRASFSNSATEGNETVAIMLQERIMGTEYIVNTVSNDGRHRIVSVWKYDKLKMPNGTNAYNYAVAVPSLEIGHSQLMRYACKVADAIGIKYGPIHGEYMVDEDGPVLIEVNCRPMGGNMQRKYVESIFGQHETDSALDSYLDPGKFEEESRKPYKIRKNGAMKFFIIPEDTDVASAPVLQIATHLRSFYSASFDQIGRTMALPETKNLETAGGTVYLLHEDEKILREDLELLHLLEMKYPRILFQGLKGAGDNAKTDPDITSVIEAAGCRGATLVFSDTISDIDGASVADSSKLADAYDSYEQGILDLSRPESFADLESVIQQIYTFAGKIRRGGRVLIPESTYCNLPYGMEGMEILLKVAGLNIELPADSMESLLIASVL